MAYRFNGQPTVYSPPSYALSQNNLPNLPMVSGLSLNSATQIFTPPPPNPVDSALNSLANTINSNVPTGIFAQYSNKIFASLEAPIIQQIINCINSLIQSVIFFLNLPQQLIGGLVAAAEGTVNSFVALFKGIENTIKGEINALLNTKLNLPVTIGLRASIQSQINKVCLNVNPTTMRGYANNPASITSTANDTSSSIISNLNSQSLISQPPAVGWSKLV